MVDISIIKELDMFKSPTFLYLHRRNKKNNSKKYDRKMGSYFGGTVSLFICFFSFIFIVIMSFEMMSSQNDNIQMGIENMDKDVNNKINLKDVNFLPSIEIRPLSSKSDL